MLDLVPRLSRIWKQFVRAIYKQGVPGPELQAERTARGQSYEVWIRGVGSVVSGC
jgi:hypothetical protein